MGRRGEEMANIVAHERDVLSMRHQQGPNGKAGVPKTHSTTIEMGTLFQRLMHEGCIRFAEHVGTYEGASASPPAYNATAATDKKNELLRQLTAFEVDERGRWSGKHAGVDDMGVAVQMAPYWSQEFWMQEQYGAWRTAFAHLKRSPPASAVTAE